MIQTHADFNATDSEIAAEKERRFWKGLGRKTKQYLEGDIIRLGTLSEQTYTVVQYAGKYTIEDVDGDQWNIQDISLVCPAEKRLDVN